MSDGGGESGKEIEHNPGKKKSRKDEFAQSIARISVAQVCESVGFQSFQQSGVNTLSDVAVRYIREIGKTATHYASLAGRTECNVFDIILGLEDLESIQGFSDASDANCCLVGSGAVRDISQYVSEAEEIQFAYSIPRFPVIKERTLKPSFERVGELPPGEHIPSWLPLLPAPETYTPLPSENKREADNWMEQNEQVREHRRPKRPFLNLKQQLASNGSVAPVSIDPGEASKAGRAAESNPFLAAPLHFGEKELSSVVLPAKLSTGAVVEQNRDNFSNHVSVLEASAPCVQAVNSRLGDSEEGRKKVILDRRPTVQLKFGIGKKSFNTAPRMQNEDVEKIAHWFGNDNDRNDKKRRAEKILKESMENSQELA